MNYFRYSRNDTVSVFEDFVPIAVLGTVRGGISG